MKVTEARLERIKDQCSCKDIHQLVLSLPQDVFDANRLCESNALVNVKFYTAMKMRLNYCGVYTVKLQEKNYSHTTGYVPFYVFSA